jgi:hypothetical protein
LNPQSAIRNPQYRGRLAPSPTGYLHLGHARTFWIAQERARANAGTLVLRNEDIDAVRFNLEFARAMIEDLCWFGFEWQEGPDCRGPSDRITRVSGSSSTAPHSTGYGSAVSFTPARVPGKTSDPPPARHTLPMTTSQSIRALVVRIVNRKL